MTTNNPFSISLGYDNVETFRRELLNYALSKHGIIARAINAGVNFGPPEAPVDPRDQIAALEYKAQLQEYRECLKIMREMLYHVEQKMLPDLRSRVSNDPEIIRIKQAEDFPAYWNYVVRIIQGVAGGNAVATMTKLMRFKFSSEESFQDDHHRYMEIVQALQDEYPGPEGKERFIQDIVNHHYVMKVREVPAHRDFVDTHVVPLDQWPECREVYIHLTRQSEAKRRIADTNPVDGSVNAARTGRCYNCDGDHYRRDCTAKDHRCGLCSGWGHLEKYCQKKSPSEASGKKPHPAAARQRSSASGGKPRADSKPKNKRWKSRARARERAFFMDLVAANDEEEPHLNRAYLADLIKESDPNEYSIVYDAAALQCADDVNEFLEEESDDEESVAYGLAAYHEPLDEEDFDEDDHSDGYLEADEWATSFYMRSQPSTIDDDRRVNVTSSPFVTTAGSRSVRSTESPAVREPIRFMSSAEMQRERLAAERAAASAVKQEPGWVERSNLAPHFQGLSPSPSSTPAPAPRRPNLGPPRREPVKEPISTPESKIYAREDVEFIRAGIVETLPFGDSQVAVRAPRAEDAKPKSPSYEMRDGLLLWPTPYRTASQKDQGDDDEGSTLATNSDWKQRSSATPSAPPWLSGADSKYSASEVRSASGDARSIFGDPRPNAAQAKPRVDYVKYPPGDARSQPTPDRQPLLREQQTPPPIKSMYRELQTPSPPIKQMYRDEQTPSPPTEPTHLDEQTPSLPTKPPVKDDGVQTSPEGFDGWTTIVVVSIDFNPSTGQYRSRHHLQNDSHICQAQEVTKGDITRQDLDRLLPGITSSPSTGSSSPTEATATIISDQVEPVVKAEASPPAAVQLSTVMRTPEPGLSHKAQRKAKASSDQTRGYMARPASADRSPTIIVDSGCIGGHIFRDKSLISDLRECATAIRDFAGQARRPGLQGNLLATSQRVLYMPESEVNLLGTDQLFKDGMIHCALMTATSFSFFDANLRPILTATNKGDGAFTCSKQDLVAAFSKQPRAYHVASESSLPLSPDEMKRAKEARDLHAALGHPGDRALTSALDNGNLPGCHLTSQDVKNASAHLGPCIACLQAKLKSPSEPESSSPPAAAIGDHLHADLIPIAPSIGGNTQLVIAVDEKSDFVVGVAIPSKTTAHVCAAYEKIIAEFQSYHHAVRHITTDDEATLRAAKSFLAVRHVTSSLTPAGLHEKKVERTIQTIKSKVRAIRHQLPFILPSCLDAELFLTVIRYNNMVPTINTGGQTPFQMFTGQKPFLPAHGFGTIGMLYLKRDTDPDLRGELGLFLNHGTAERYMRIYVPTASRIYSAKKFIALPHQLPPTSWRFQPNPHYAGVSAIPTTGPSAANQGPSIAASTPPTDAPPMAILPPTANQPTVMVPLPLTIAQPTPPTARDSSLPTQPSNEVAVLPNQEGGGGLLDEARLMIRQSSPSLAQEGAVAPTENAPTRPSVTTEPTLVRKADKTQPPPAPTEPTEPTKPTDVPLTLPTRDPKSLPTADPVPPTRDPKRKPTAVPIPSNATAKPTEPIVTRTGRQIHKPSRYAYYAMTSDQFRAMHTNLAQLLQNPARRDSVLASIHEEVDNIMKPSIVQPIRMEDIPEEHRKDVIGMWLFHREKTDAEGNFVKDKARIVTLSQLRDPSSIGDTFAPTVNPISVYSCLQTAATNRSLLASYDVKGAFLETPMDESTHMYVRFPPNLTEIIVSKHAHLKSFINPDRSLTCRLKAYIYGLHESPAAFNLLISQYLASLGYKQSVYDKCLFFKDEDDGSRTLLTLHVDDLLLIAAAEAHRQYLEDGLSKRFTISIQRDEISYLQMSIKRQDSSIVVNQAGYIEKILEKFGIKQESTAPTSPDFMVTSPDDSTPIGASKFLSLTMSLMYLARFTRPDILFPVSYLATKSSAPTSKDFLRLVKIAQYVRYTKARSIVFQEKCDLKLSIFCDASHLIHHDSKGHGGLIIMLGSSPVFWKSWKLKLVTRSSTESELVALEEATTYALWMKNLLQQITNKVEENPITIFQDNLSTMAIVANGGTFSKSKHITARQMFIAQHVQAKDIQLKHCRSESMAADMLTKPLSGVQLDEACASIGMK